MNESSLGSILCEYLYGSFKLLKAAVEVIMKSLKKLLEQLNTMYNTIVSTLRTTVDISINFILDGIRVFEKYIVNTITEAFKDKNESKNRFCTNLFKCSAALQQLLNPNSLFGKTLSYFGYKQEFQQVNNNFVFGLINDYKQFQDTICNFNFTYEIGLSAVRDLMDKWSNWCTDQLDMLERCRKRIYNWLKTYLDELEQSRVFDLLDDIESFFDCVLVDTDSCSNIQTANSFYNKAMNFFHLSKDSNGYKLNPDWSAKWLNFFNSRMSNISNVNQILIDLSNKLVNPDSVKKAKNAFNLSEKVFPGGMGLTDFNKGRWEKNPCYSYFQGKSQDLLNILDHSAYENISISEAVENMKFENNKLIFHNRDKTYEIPEEDIKNYIKEYDEDYYVVVSILDGTDINEIMFDETTDTFVPTMKVAFDISVKNNEKLKQLCEDKFKTIDYKENELLTSW